MAESFRSILGIRFFVGAVPELLGLTAQGGLVVVPAAPALAELPGDSAYRAAVEGSDFALTDSGFMVLLWYLFKGERLQRISGLKYLRALMNVPEFRAPDATYWIMPSEVESQANCDWLASQGLTVGAGSRYIAPHYPKGSLDDPALLAYIEAKRPKFVVINLGGGVQERLGYYLCKNLSYRPAVICTGAAIAFSLAPAGEHSPVGPPPDASLVFPHPVFAAKIPDPLPPGPAPRTHPVEIWLPQRGVLSPRRRPG